MYFGTSPAIDFCLCLGLGLASSACAYCSVQAAQSLARDTLPKSTQMAIRCLVFTLFAFSFLAIATVIGGTKGVRDPNSTLGYALGIAALAPFIFIRKSNEPH